MPYLFRSLLVPFFIFASSIAALAGPITGRVLDPDGRAVGGVDVLLVRGGAIASTTRTDSTGAFRMDGPDDGRVEIRVALEGFHARPVTIGGGAAPRDLGTIELSVSAIAESVVVSAAQTDVPLSTTSSSVSIITGEELRARQIDGLADALRLVPGLAVAAAGGRGAVTSVFPRGGESDYSLVLIDGVQANAFGGGLDFAHVPVVNVERIEVVRGPQSALYGSNAIGAVIRVITKRGGAPRGSASFEAGSFDTTRATAASSGGIGLWQWGGSAERLATDGRNGDRTAAGEAIVNDDYVRTALSGGGGWQRADGAGVRGDVQYIEDEHGAPGPFGSDPAGLFEGIDAVSRGTNDRWLSSISGTTPSGGKFRGQAQATHGRIDGVFVSPFGESENWSRRTTARAQADIELTSSMAASLGAEVLRERAGGTFITASGAREVPVERGQTGVFGEVRWHDDARIYLTGGVRVERITRDALDGNADGFAPRPDFGEDTVVSANPKIAAAWFVRSADAGYTKLRASAGTGIRPPDAFEIAFTDNPGLKPERSRSFDFGIDQALFDGRALLEATAFFNEYDDLIVAVGSFSGTSRYRTDNISNARARGLELTASGRLRLNARRPVDLQFGAGYTFLESEILAVDGAPGAPPPFAPGDPLLRRPKHRFTADVLLDAGRLSGFLHGGGRGRVLDVEPSLGTFGGLFYAAGYSVWNAGLSWQLFEAVELFGHVNNLFGREYEEVLGFPALPRGVVAGLRVAASH
ncbi:MAG TPA: TonB-dependent receptor [Vicinamibacterales bacterium]|nr:TonB-dependent receptor [Vicinamibacterales bacterium]